MRTLLTFTFLALISVSFCQNPWDPEPRPDEWWQQRHAQYVQNSIENGENIQVVFFGDSITEAWGGAGLGVWNDVYAPLGGANYGIGGDQTQHVLWRILNGEVQNLNPKVVVLKIGTNNLGNPNNDAIVQGVATIVSTLRSMLPSSKILLLGVLPRPDGLFQRIADMNIKISKIADGENVFFLDMFSDFADGWNSLVAELYHPDLVHLLTPGYVQWELSMRKLFNELMQ